MKTSLFIIALFAVIISTQATCGQQLPILNGRAVSLPKPAYPRDAQNNCVKGEVRVRIEYPGGGGGPTSAEMIGGYELLRAAAEEAALQARFNRVSGVDPNAKISGILVYNFTGTPGVFCIDTKKILNTRALKFPARSFAEEFPEEDVRLPEKGVDVKVRVSVDYVGEVVYAYADESTPAAFKKYGEAIARKVRFSPMNDMGNIKALGYLIIRFGRDGSITLPQIPAQK